MRCPSLFADGFDFSASFEAVPFPRNRRGGENSRRRPCCGEERRSPSTPQKLHFVKFLLRSEFVPLLTFGHFRDALKSFFFTIAYREKLKKSQPLRMTGLERRQKSRGGRKNTSDASADIFSTA